MTLATAIVRTPDATVDKLETQGFTRFMNYTGAAAPLTPLQAVEANDEAPIVPQSKTLIGAFFRWLRTFFRLIGALIRK